MEIKPVTRSIDALSARTRFGELSYLRGGGLFEKYCQKR